MSQKILECSLSETDLFDIFLEFLKAKVPQHL